VTSAPSPASRRRRTPPPGSARRRSTKGGGSTTRRTVTSRTRQHYTPRAGAMKAQVRNNLDAT
jgi:hypothetical protein